MHVCPPYTDEDPRERGLQRNFVFKTLPFAEAVHRCANDPEAPPLEPLLEEGERYYLRSVGADPRRQASDFHALFPELAAECSLLPLRGAGSAEPEQQRRAREAAMLDPGLYHSSVLRLASSDTQVGPPFFHWLKRIHLSLLRIVGYHCY